MRFHHAKVDVLIRQQVDPEMMAWLMVELAGECHFVTSPPPQSFSQVLVQWDIVQELARRVDLEDEELPREYTLWWGTQGAFVAGHQNQNNIWFIFYVESNSDVPHNPIRSLPERLVGALVDEAKHASHESKG